jgi:protein-disulfide isomerase
MRKGFRFAGPALLALGLVAGSPGVAQDSDANIQTEIDALKAGQKNIQRQLNEIKKLIQAQAKPAAAKKSGPKVDGVTFNLGSNEVKGDAGAPLTLLEFTDYQ